MIIKVKELGITSASIEKMDDVEQLKQLKSKLGFIIANLNNQLETYKSNYTINGISGNYDWFVRAKKKKRLYGAVSQQMQVRIGTLNAKFKDNERTEFVNRFFSEVQQYLSDEEFRTLTSKARCHDNLHDKVYISKAKLNEMFSFANWLSSNYAYIDNTDSGDIYLCLDSGNAKTETQIYEEWKKKGQTPLS